MKNDDGEYKGKTCKANWRQVLGPTIVGITCVIVFSVIFPPAAPFIIGFAALVVIAKTVEWLQNRKLTDEQREAKRLKEQRQIEAWKRRREARRLRRMEEAEKERAANSQKDEKLDPASMLMMADMIING